MFAAPVGAAHTVRARRDVPNRRHNWASMLSCVIRPFDPPYRVRKDRRAAMAGLCRAHLLRDQFERFVPRHAFEPAFALAAFSDGRVEQPILAVNHLIELPDLRADVSAGDRLSVRAVDLDDLAVLQRHGQAAGVRAIKRARGIDDGGVSAEDRLGRCRAPALGWSGHLQT